MKNKEKSGKTIRLTTEQFIEKAKQVHANKYDYSKVKYINQKTKVCIICPEHGEFWQIPNNHLKGSGCPACKNRLKINTNVFIERAKKKHGNKYDYSKVKCSKSTDYIEIICPIHGEFTERVCEHLKSHGCPKCGHNFTWDKRGRISTEEFILKARQVHGNKFDYSKVEYINNRTPITIICPKHGEFSQKPNSHLNGNGCSKCRNSRLENKIYNYLEKNNVKYIKEKDFEWLLNKNNNKLHLDFYLPEYNIAIECQGIQHFIPIKRGRLNDESALKIFNEIRENDIIKEKLCNDNGVRVLYFTNNTILNKWNNNLYSKLYTDIDTLFKEMLG